MLTTHHKPATPKRNPHGAEAVTEVQGVLDRVRFYRDGFGVASLIADDGRDDNIVTIKGNFPELRPGLTYNVTGIWQDDPRWGRQLLVVSLKMIRPSTQQGVERYLTFGPFPNVGASRAAAMVERWGMETFHVLDADDAIAQLDGIKGITPDRAQKIVEEWQAHKDEASSLISLYKYGLTRWQVGKLIARYGNGAARMLEENPYQVIGEIDRFGFKTVDAIAARVGIPRDDIRRARAAVIYLLDNAAQEGHCYLPKNELCSLESAHELGIPVEVLSAGIARNAALVVEENDVFLNRMHAAEQAISYYLKDLIAVSTHTTPPTVFEPKNIAMLTPTQAEAVRQAQTCGLLVVTGGPGTGKTFTLQAMLDVWRRQGLRVQLAAPTGKAAQRMTESTGEPARTIHRLLHWTPDGFQYNELLKLETDVVVVDEASMVDVELAAALVSAIDTDKTRLILVGDVDQLPSVGPGQILHDIIESKACPVVRLDRIMRQAEGSAIVRAAHAVNHGEKITTDNAVDDLKVFAFEDETAPEVLAERVIELVGRTLPAAGYDAIKDVQVLSPMKRGPVGVDAMNTALQSLLNPASQDKTEMVIRDGRDTVSLRVGDKVIQIRNNYQLDVFNGEVGFVVDIDGPAVKVDFGGDVDGVPRVIEYRDKIGDNLALAYALTIHKSQGSEFPVVVMPLHTTHYIMLQRKLLYTGITRARECCVLLATEKALRRGIKNNEESRRYTRLQTYLQGVAHGN